MKCPRCSSENVTKHREPGFPGADPIPAERGYRCAACGLLESRSEADRNLEELLVRWDDVHPWTDEQWKASIERVRHIDEENDRAWVWPTEGRFAEVTDRATRAQKRADSQTYGEAELYSWNRFRREPLPEHKYGFPVGEERVAAVLRAPEDDAPRWGYARWLRTFDNEATQSSAAFVEWQLRLAESWRANPRFDLKSQLPAGIFSSRKRDEKVEVPDQLWWRYPGYKCEYERPRSTASVGRPRSSITKALSTMAGSAAVSSSMSRSRPIAFSRSPTSSTASRRSAT
jgi:hypothetical protein